ncbi:MAG: hypothetical protein OHK0052_03030 [Anaerolineales bacterium]
MVTPDILGSVQNYLLRLKKEGIPVGSGVIFGSQILGTAHEWSDIDLLIISPEFDRPINRKDVDLLWYIAAKTDSRIEPIPVGEKQFAEDRSNPILEIARREGQVIPLAE